MLQDDVRLDVADLLTWTKGKSGEKFSKYLAHIFFRPFL